MKTSRKKIIVGIDLGSVPIRVAIAERSEEGIKFISYDVCSSKGMVNGEVIDPESAATAIHNAAYLPTNFHESKLLNFVVSVGGLPIRRQTSHGEVRVKREKVSEQDVYRVLQSARTIQLPPDYEILHIIPREYVIDKQTKTSQPLGLTGSSLEVNAIIVTVESAYMQKLVKACRLAGLKRFNFVLQSLASVRAALLAAKQEQGMALFDIDGEPTEIPIYANGSLCNSSKIYFTDPSANVTFLAKIDGNPHFFAAVGLVLLGARKHGVSQRMMTVGRLQMFQFKQAIRRIWRKLL